MFDRFDWRPDRMLLDDLVFRLEHYKTSDWDGGDHFLFWKTKRLVDQYQDFFKRRADFRPERLFELGIFDGGSVAFWHEVFRPRMHVALDLQDRVDSPYLLRYAESRGVSSQIKTFWKTDQADKAMLRQIAATEFDGPLDLIIDDASHMYELTKASFEALFPLLAPGGLYLIEDWAWAHWPEFIGPEHPWADREPLTTLVVELVKAVGTGRVGKASHPLISDLVVYQGFVAVERGGHQFEEPADLSIDNHVLSRQKPWSVARLSRRAGKGFKGRLLRYARVVRERMGASSQPSGTSMQ